MQVQSDEVEVRYTHMLKNNVYRWSNEATSWIYRNQIIKTLKQPKLMNSRSHMFFEL